MKETNESDLSDAKLIKANLEETNLTGVKLSGTLMKGVILCNTTMPDRSVIYVETRDISVIYSGC
jgi:hypothetical protein